MCVRATVCVCVYMHVCESVNMESTTYCIHLALPNASNLQRQSTTQFVCMCVRVCVCMHVCVCQHGVYHLSYSPSITKCKQPTEIKDHTIIVCVCVCVYVCICQHGVYHQSYSPSITKCKQPTEIKDHTIIVCVCVSVYVCVCVCACMSVSVNM